MLDPATARAYVLVDDGLVPRFGAALAWADRHEALFLDVLVDGSPPAPGIIARRAAEFSPAPAVWSVRGRSLDEALASDPLTEEVPTPEGYAEVLASHGLEVVREHGVLRGEVLGLEVARTVGDRLEVGVGRHDRIARLEMRPYEDVDSALREAASTVRHLRRPGAPPHPANTLARGRWLRAVVCRDPATYGFGALLPVAPPLPWFDLPEAGAAPAVGTRLDGSPVVAVFSVGVDLDLVPTAADCRLLYGPECALVVVVPDGDDLPVTRSLATRLKRPAEVATVPRGWEAEAR